MSSKRQGFQARREYVPHNDFQRWVKPRLDGRDWSYRDLARQLHEEGQAVSENFIWRVVRGDPARYANANRPGYEVAFGIGKALGDAPGAVRAAGYPYQEAPLDLSAVLVPLDPAPYLAALNGPLEVSASPSRELSGEIPSALHVESEMRPLLVRGSCMEPVVRDGDILFVNPAESVKDGDLVIALVDNVTPTCKRIRIPGDGEPSSLVPLNGEGKIRENRFVVQGVVTHVVEDVRHRLLRYEESL